MEALGGRNLQGLPCPSAYLKAKAMKAVSVPPNYQGRGRKGFCISTSFLDSNRHLCCCYSSIKGHSSSPGSWFLQSSSLPASSSATASYHLPPEPEHLIYDKTHLAFPDTCLLSPSNCFVSLNRQSLLWPAKRLECRRRRLYDLLNS